MVGLAEASDQATCSSRPGGNIIFSARAALRQRCCISTSTLSPDAGAMRRAGKVSILLLLVCASTAAAVRQLNTTLAAAQPADDVDEDGYKYGGKFVPNFESQPWKAKFVQCELAPRHMCEAALPLEAARRKCSTVKTHTCVCICVTLLFTCCLQSLMPPARPRTTPSVL